MATLKLSNVRRRNAILILMLLSLGVVSCKDDDDNGKEEAKSIETFAEVRPGAVVFDLTTINGTVEVTGQADNDSVIIRTERIVRASSQSEADAGLQELWIQIGGSNGIYLVSTHQPTIDDGREYEVNYEVRLPSRARVVVDQVNGNVSVSAMNTEYPIDYAARVSTTNGNQSFTDIRGSVKAETVNGTIFCETQYTEPDTFDLTMVDGTIDFRIPASYSAALEAHLGNGTISFSNLSLLDSISTPTFVSGFLGSGDGVILLNGTNGTIQIRGQ